MLWASITLMTFIDLAGVVGGVCIAILIYKNRTFFRSSGNNGNLLVIAAGALIVDAPGEFTLLFWPGGTDDRDVCGPAIGGRRCDGGVPSVPMDVPAPELAGRLSACMTPPSPIC